ncbi:MAG: hypothetical protein IT352_07405 [Gemmatimonadales bacterium]|nr:hypothetical protein [Gemmatimonadales bacterium]
MMELLVVFLMLVGAGFIALAVAAGLEKAVRRRRHSPTAGVTPLATSSAPLSQAERQRRAFARIMADLKAEAEHAERMRDSLASLNVYTADELPRRSQR